MNDGRSRLLVVVDVGREWVRVEGRRRRGDLYVGVIRDVMFYARSRGDSRLVLFLLP